MGNGRKQMSEMEEKIRTVITKRIVASQAIVQGEEFTKDNVCIKRSKDGELALHWHEIIGLKATKEYEVNQGIFFNKIGESPFFVVDLRKYQVYDVF